jgi:hypothetical protein
MTTFSIQPFPIHSLTYSSFLNDTSQVTSFLFHILLISLIF